MKRLLNALGLATACGLLAQPSYAQNPDPNRNPNNDNTRGTAQGTRDKDNRNQPATTQDNRNNNDQNRNQDNRNNNDQNRNQNPNAQPGTQRDNTQGNRPRTEDIRDNAQSPRQGGDANQPKNGNRVQGRVTRVGNNQFVVQTQDGRNVTVFANPQTRYALNNRAAQFSDLRVGSNIYFTYTPQGDQWYADQVTFIPANDNATPAVQPPDAPNNNAQTIDGQIVRVVGQDQVVVRTADGKEIILYVSPQTTYTWNNQPGQFTNLQAGVPIQANYEVVGNRHMARRILGGPRR